MSNYRDDTQETIVLSSDAFGKITSGDVEKFSFTETILSKVRHNVEEIIRLGDEDLSRRKGRLDSELGFADQVIHSVRKFQLIEEAFILADHSFVKQSELITEDLGLGEVEQVGYKMVHIEPFKVADAHFTYKTAFQSISDRLKLSDSLHALSRSSDLIEESLVLSDSTRDKLKTLIVETLGLGQELEQYNLVHSQVSESFKLHDLAVRIFSDTIEDTIRFGDEFQKLSDTVELVVESLVFSDQVSGQRKVRSLAESSLSFSESIEGVKQASSSVTELLFLDDEYQDDQEIIGAWTTTADGWNMSRYYDYPYEQLIVIGDKLYGVTSNGIEELKHGAQSITAKIKTAKLDLGDGGLIHPESMILEYSLDGQLSVDVGTTQTGYQQTFNYALKKEPSEYLTNGRVVFGRGLRGRHFEFAVNIEGSTAYINDMVVNITKTKRRI
ncbi:hypothetical protein QUG64_03030 [Acinetobacter lwoffii]|uniref:Uncharacterized protein n=1 Tax=Acinetobacter lwoffii NCTC 5866 = CIP 64.10 = NIPH 512 TaxID=981327 RepID=A0ABP2ZJI3_ACILW|nr:MULTISPECIES: hypothetical protein [Acinetobacter]ENU16719.1 hypothetical protein F995_02205 [Acinetobacter sp. CIP A162]ESJ96074.1 hypothetical protein P800_00897 [Acinetobacter lwoffii NCTC 5866 = CIP 64.10 = NIPH 512]QXB40414.1 hypothetical protein I6L23_14770 [Acinetobacter lwoffii]SUU30184.1 Uncharacterised protein [Acinetobacter lwoffii]VFQ38537.1 Uncharacterised protein [Acinetobacter lwoffii]